MRKGWSTAWKASSQPRKQRKYRHNAPMHARRGFLSAHVSPELRKRFGVRSFILRKGDEVVVMRGSFRGIRGSVERVDIKATKVYLEEVKAKKVDGSEVQRALQPSNLMITKLSLDDKKRQAVMERSGKKEAVKEERKAEPVKRESKKGEKEEKPKPAKKEEKKSQNKTERRTGR